MADTIEKNKAICSCGKYPKEVLLKNIFNYLDAFDENEIPKVFSCSEHENEKKIFYCKKCGQNCCNKCINDCVENKHEIQFLKNDIQIINSINYIYKKVKEKKLNFF
jgi:hypothetical protein